ncbi:MAG: hypothetical protein EPN82_07270 [Bacteroidetes bacterium]|nr:MAG: hypothetical protein EPN82_07270 [Bacteroidota bacterium]
METEQKIQNIHTLLKVVFVFVPIAAGFDKFTNLLTDWTMYVNGILAGMLPFSTAVFMKIVGVIEIIAGIIVLFKPKIGALIVSLWLFLIAINLMFTGKYFDVAVRDMVMAVSAYTFWQLTIYLDKKKEQ